MKTWIEIKENEIPKNTPLWALEENHIYPLLMEYVYIDDEWFWCRIYEVPEQIGLEWSYSSRWDGEYEITHYLPFELLPKLDRKNTSKNYHKDSKIIV